MPGDWPVLQGASGETFSSLAECARYAGRGGTLYKPMISVSPTSGTAGDRFDFTGSGFHGLSPMTMSVAVTGQPPYFVVPNGVTLADGTYAGAVVFEGCGAAFHTDITFTFTDSFGVHASTHITLC